jgi:3-hydroxybutyryl-CoA dehydrogenase
MGSGIAQVAAQAGFRTVLFDVNDEMVRKGRAAIEKNLEKLVEKKRISAEERQTALNRLQYTTEITDCKAELVIEAIIEQKQAKLDLFRQLAEINTPQTIFATNTSSLPVSEIAEAVPGPQRVAGMHFFNPAPLMKLVEVVKAAQTLDTVVDAVTSVAVQMGKVPVVCRDAPGFIVNRVARHYYLEAMKLAEEGYTDIAAIDTVMQSTGFKMGPFALMDLIGMDINYNVSRIVYDALGHPPRLQPSPIQAAKVAAGELGRKTGKGFYEYES